MSTLVLSPRAALALPHAPEPIAPGQVLALVTRVERGAIAVVDDTGAARDIVGDVGGVAVGDHVVVDGTGVVVSVLERRSALWRARSQGGSQILAANVDVVCCIVAADQGLRPRRLERALTLAYDSGAEPVVVITKADLVDDDALAAIVWDAQALAPGCLVITTSTTNGAGLDTLRALLVSTDDGGDLVARVAVMLGVSGAGKSALTNALVGAPVLAEGALSKDGLRGAHTTSSRSVHLVPGGGVVIDTPGLRAFAVAASDDAIAAAFADIDALAPACRYRDCAHDAEPGCAVRDAVPAERLASYHRLQREAERLRARAEGGLALVDKRQQERSLGRLIHEAQSHRRRRRGEP